MILQPRQSQISWIKLPKVAKQAFGDRSGDITETFLAEHDASFEEITTSVQRRSQYAQLILATSGAQPFKQVCMRTTTRNAGPTERLNLAETKY